MAWKRHMQGAAPGQRLFIVEYLDVGGQRAATAEVQLADDRDRRLVAKELLQRLARLRLLIANSVSPLRVPDGSQSPISGKGRADGDWCSGTVYRATRPHWPAASTDTA